MWSVRRSTLCCWAVLQGGVAECEMSLVTILDIADTPSPVQTPLHVFDGVTSGEEARATEVNNCTLGEEKLTSFPLNESDSMATPPTRGKAIFVLNYADRKEFLQPMNAATPLAPLSMTRPRDRLGPAAHQWESQTKVEGKTRGSAKETREDSAQSWPGFEEDLGWQERSRSML